MVILLGSHVFILHLLHLFLNTLVVSLLESGDFLGSLFSFFDLLPGLHFLLLQEGDSVGKELGVSLDTGKTNKLEAAASIMGRSLI